MNYISKCNKDISGPKIYLPNFVVVNSMVVIVVVKVVNIGIVDFIFVIIGVHFMDVMSWKFEAFVSILRVVGSFVLVIVVLLT